MIRVHRPTSPPPPLDPHSRPIRDAMRQLERVFERGESSPRSDSLYRYELYGDRRVRAALSAMFRGKCAYCESPIDGPTFGDIEHFRPKSGALNLDGTASTSHYWWLTYEWTNLLLTCLNCSRSKGLRFPVHGPRSGWGESVDTEQPVLLDPCRDNPQEHLVFLPDGTVASETERGSTTIAVLNLNRHTLVEHRRYEASALRSAIKVLPRAELDQEMDSSKPFLALRMQLLGARPVTKRVQARVKASFDIRQEAQQNYSLGNDPSRLEGRDVERYVATARWVERVVLHNFRPIGDLTIQCLPSSSAGGPWTCLLGENGAGKTSVLRAVALALMGATYRDRLGLDARRDVRSRRTGGFVEVYLSGVKMPLRLDFSATRSSYDGPSDPQVFLLGYGSTRLILPSGVGTPVSTPSVCRVDTLFDPFLPATDPTPWLLSLTPRRFEDVANSLASLLPTFDGSIERDSRHNRVFLRSGKTHHPLNQLSDGYQAMLVLACDVMNAVLSLWPTPAHAEGIVLIDELGAHLHPRWQMRIVSALRAVLPRVQFIVTTHDPLCLRGLEDGEVVVVRRNADDEIVAITDLPPVKGLRVDQLLTSEYFGLGSTNDPELDDLYREYYGLRAKATLSPAQRGRLADVEARLTELDHLGVTERERLVLEAADQFIAERRERGDQAAGARMTDDLHRELVDLWSAHLPGPADDPD